MLTSEILGRVREIQVRTGRQVADVHDDTTDSGKIGFQVHPGDQFGPMKIIVREMLLKPL